MDMNLYEFVKSKIIKSKGLKKENSKKKIYIFVFGKGCNKVRLSEPKIREIMYQIVKAVQHMHSSGIFHRDIKPENILVRSPQVNERFEIKLADFGSCKGIFSRHPYTEYISTRWYRAPECLLTDGYYSYPMDVWSIGCCFYETATFRPLFPGSNELDQINKIHELLGTPSAELLYKFKKSRALSFDFPKYDSVDFTKAYANDFSSVGLDLLRKMLTYDPEMRITAKEALQHPFLSESLQNDKTAAPTGGKVTITQSKVPSLQTTTNKPSSSSGTKLNLAPVEQSKSEDLKEAKDLPLSDKNVVKNAMKNGTGSHSDSSTSDGAQGVTVTKKSKTLRQAVDDSGSAGSPALSMVKTKKNLLEAPDADDEGKVSPRVNAGSKYALPQESYEEAKALILQSLHQRQQPKRHNSLLWKKFYNEQNSDNNNNNNNGSVTNSYSPTLQPKKNYKKHQRQSDHSPVAVSDTGNSVASMALFKELFQTNNDHGGVYGNQTSKRKNDIVLDVYKKPLGKTGTHLPKIQENISSWLAGSSTLSQAGLTHHITGRHQQLLIAGNDIGGGNVGHKRSTSISPHFGASNKSKHATQLVHIHNGTEVGLI